MDEPSPNVPSGSQPGSESPTSAKMADYMNLGTLVGLGAALGLLFGTMLSNLTWGLIIGAALGTVTGAIVEAQRAK